jgi:hypothetical protein
MADDGPLDHDVRQQLIRQAFDVVASQPFALHEKAAGRCDVKILGEAQFARGHSNAVSRAIGLALSRMNVNLPEHRAFA